MSTSQHVCPCLLILMILSWRVGCVAPGVLIRPSIRKLRGICRFPEVMSLWIVPECAFVDDRSTVVAGLSVWLS